MLIIGLTGSIASGKSTVSNLLSTPPYSLPIIDADLIARLVVAPGSSGLSQIITTFSSSTPELLHPDGSLNRPALGRRVFGDPAALKKLNGITHPLVRKEMARQVIKAWLSGAWACVADVPLLFESGLERFVGVVITVGVSEETQMLRLMGRDGAVLSESEARERVKAQMPVGEKVRRTERWGREGRGWVVWNEGSKEELREEVGRVIKEIGEGRRGWWRWMTWGNPVGVLAALWVWWRNRRRVGYGEEGKVNGVGKAKL